MGRSADEIAREIEATRGDMESRIIALRQASRRTLNQTIRTAAVVAGIAVGVAFVAGAAFAAYRYSRPATPAERLARVLPIAWRNRARSARRDVELRMRKGVPSMRLYVGERQVGEEGGSGRAEKVAVRAAQAFATALASAIVTRGLAQLTGAAQKKK